MEKGKLLCDIGLFIGLYWGYMGIMAKKTEIYYLWFRV